MSFAGVKDPVERANILAYLATLSPSPLPFPPPEAAPAPEGAAATAPAEGAAPAATTGDAVETPTTTAPETAVEGTPAWFTRNSMYGPGGARVAPTGPAPVSVVGPLAANVSG